MRQQHRHDEASVHATPPVRGTTPRCLRRPPGRSCTSSFRPNAQRNGRHAERDEKRGGEDEQKTGKVVWHGGCQGPATEYSEACSMIRNQASSVEAMRLSAGYLCGRR